MEIKSKNLMFLMIWILILLLLVFSMVVHYRTEVFKVDCKETFDINEFCPCISGKSYDFSTLNSSLSNITIKQKV